MDLLGWYGALTNVGPLLVLNNLALYVALAVALFVIAFAVAELGATVISGAVYDAIIKAAGHSYTRVRRRIVIYAVFNAVSALIYSLSTYAGMSTEALVWFGATVAWEVFAGPSYVRVTKGNDTKDEYHLRTGSEAQVTAVGLLREVALLVYWVFLTQLFVHFIVLK